MRDESLPHPLTGKSGRALGYAVNGRPGQARHGTIRKANTCTQQIFSKQNGETADASL